MTRQQIKNSAIRIVELIDAGDAGDHEINMAIAVFNYDVQQWRTDRQTPWHRREAGGAVSLAAIGLFIGMVAIWGMVLS